MKTIHYLSCFICSVLFTCSLYADASWTTSDIEPSNWTPRSNNLISGVAGTINGAVASGYSSNDPNVVTDSIVPTEGGKDWIVGFQVNSSISYTFNSPKTLEEVRISACYLAGNTYTRLAITGIYVKLTGSDSWNLISNSEFSDIAGRNQSVILCASLSDSATGYISQGVTALKIEFGNVGALASYCAEIEAVGYSEATGPIVETFNITPVKTKAKLSGVLSEVGTDSTSCDIFLSINNSQSTKILQNITNLFEYQLNKLTPATTYSYILTISNNAPVAKATVINGQFTTLSESDQTALWVHDEYTPNNWIPLGNNIIKTLDAAEKTGLSYAASQDVTKLTNSSVPDPVETSEVVGFLQNGTISWIFDNPMIIQKIRFSSLWDSTLYNGISISTIYVKFLNSENWEELNVPSIEWTGGTQIGQIQTLIDMESGNLASNVVALKIVFGKQKAAIANYYSEIEVTGYENAYDPTNRSGIILTF